MAKLNITSKKLILNVLKLLSKKYGDDATIGFVIKELADNPEVDEAILDALVI